MIRVVLDTNVFISASIAKLPSPPLIIYHAFISQQFLNITSQAILEEIEEVLRREHIVKIHKFTTEQRQAFLEQLTRLSYITTSLVVAEKSIIKDDHSDDKFLIAAVEGNADYIVSGDHHLLDLKAFEKIPILTPKEFVIKLEAE